MKIVSVVPELKPVQKEVGIVKVVPLYVNAKTADIWIQTPQNPIHKDQSLKKPQRNNKKALVLTSAFSFILTY